ncbi:hypothetical protein [Bacillus sp. USDA818B3_A]|uniref:hypothetical protein n=1 Tax=Bacillus sp. USDA818B3_A TaxID=2698834 RepID=UPI00136A857F|nr:hypothetical protein [Bacillus sp. USDA818B3_A]
MKRKIISAIAVLLLLAGNFIMAKPALAYGETAVPISVNKLYDGTLQGSYEKYYTFTLKSDGVVTLSMLRNTKSSWYTVLSDTNGSTIESFSTAYGTTVTGYEERQVGLPKGTYIVRVSSNYNGSTAPYKFQVKYTAGSGYEKEKNNTQETANPILLNTTYKGAIQSDYDYDYYIFTTPADGNVTISMRRNQKASWGVTLYYDDLNENQYYKTAYGTTAAGYEERQYGLPKGTYIIKVDNSTSSQDIMYDFQVKFTAGSQYEKEQNDSFETANLIQVNKSCYGVINDYYDDDYYVFTMPNDGNVTLSMKRNTKASWYVNLYNIDGGNPYKSFTTAYGPLASGYEEKQIGLPKGTYIVKIENQSSSEDLQYQFQVKYNAGNYFEKELNNKFETATPVVLNAVYKGTLQNTYDDDYYSFSVAKTQQVRVSIPRKPGVSWYAYLYNENGSYIGYFNTAYGSTVTGNEERTYTLAPGKYYFKIVNYNNAVDYPYEFGIWTTTPMLAPGQVTVKNNKGTSDIITVNGLGTGDVVKVYNASSGGTLLKSGTASSTGVAVMSVTQVGQKSGKIYVTVTKAGWRESARTAVEFIGEQSNPLVTSQVKIENNKGKADVMTISSLGNGDVVKVYNTSGKLIGVSMPAEAGQAVIAFTQLGQIAGKVYVAITRAGMTESGKTTISFVGEQTNALSASQIVVVNNKGKADTITISSIKIGDKISVFNASGKQIAAATASSTKAIVSVTQLGTAAGNVYVTLTRTGMLPSVKTKVSYKAE